LAKLRLNVPAVVRRTRLSAWCIHGCSQLGRSCACLSWVLSIFHEERDAHPAERKEKAGQIRGGGDMPIRSLSASSRRLGGQMVGLLPQLVSPKINSILPVHRDSLGKARDERENWEISHGSPKFLSHLAEFTSRLIRQTQMISWQTELRFRLFLLGHSACAAKSAMPCELS